jgi:hypothetical protein
MALAIALIVRWATQIRTVVAASVVVFLLVMMAAMLGAVVVYFSDPGGASLVIGIWLAAGIMAASVFPVFALFLSEAHRRIEGGDNYHPRDLGSLWGFAAAVVLLVVGSELLMGRGFGLAAGGSSVHGGIPVQLAAVVSSPWFLFPMSLEMSLTVAWLRVRLGGPLGVMMAAQAGMMLFAPPALPSPIWVVSSGAATSAVMTIAVAYLLVQVYRGRSLVAGVRSFAGLFFAASGLAAVGLAIWSVGGTIGVYAVATVLQMTIFFLAAVMLAQRPATDPPEPSPGTLSRSPAPSVPPAAGTAAPHRGSQG